MNLSLLFVIVVLPLSSRLAVSFASDDPEDIINSCTNDGSLKSVGFGDVKTRPASHEAESTCDVDKEYKNHEYCMSTTSNQKPIKNLVLFHHSKK